MLAVTVINDGVVDMLKTLLVDNRIGNVFDTVDMNWL